MIRRSENEVPSDLPFLELSFRARHPGLEPGTGIAKCCSSDHLTFSLSDLLIGIRACPLPSHMPHARVACCAVAALSQRVLHRLRGLLVPRSLLARASPALRLQQAAAPPAHAVDRVDPVPSSTTRSTTSTNTQQPALVDPVGRRCGYYRSAFASSVSPCLRGLHFPFANYYSPFTHAFPPPHSSVSLCLRGDCLIF